MLCYYRKTASRTRTDVLRFSSALYRPPLSPCPTAGFGVRSVYNRIRVNLFFSLVYNTIGIPLAAGLFMPLLHTSLPPEYAALSMAASSVSVVVSSLSLRRFKRPVIDVAAADKRKNKVAPNLAALTKA